MPYDPESGAEVAKMKKRLEKTYANVSDKDARQAIHILNSMLESGKDEGAAWGGIHSQLQQKGLKKKTASGEVAFKIAVLIIREACVPPEIRDKATHFRDLVKSGHLDQMAVDDILYSGGSRDYILRTASGQHQRQGEIERKANAKLVRTGILGKKAVWFPGEVVDDNWQTGQVQSGPGPRDYLEDGSQVPPKRTNDGDQLDRNDNIVPSIPRIEG
jgi:hypothetical protein